MTRAPFEPTRANGRVALAGRVRHQAALEVVMIESQDDAAERIRRVLHRHGEGRFVVRRCRDLRSARELLLAECPDCVLLALDLPESQGLRTLSHVLSLTSSPLVVLSDEDSAGTRLHALSNSAIGFVSKRQLRADGLVEAIVSAIDQQDRLIDLRARAHRPQWRSPSTSTALRDTALDPLTGTLNEHALVAAVDRELHHPRHALEVLGLVHCSVRRVDGTSVDDAGLRHVARQIESAVRDTDSVARIRTTEFVVVAPHLPDRDELDRLADRVVGSIRGSHASDGDAPPLAVSVGRSAVTIGHACVIAPPLPQLLLTSAELALRDAKAQQRCEQR